MSIIFLGIEQKDVDILQEIVDGKKEEFSFVTSNGIKLVFNRPDRVGFKKEKLKTKEK